jgi:hypothetical protein
VIVVALKWADLFFDVDPFTGDAIADRKSDFPQPTRRRSSWRSAWARPSIAASWH